MNFLITSGADLTVTDGSGALPIQAAAVHGHVAVFDLLLKVLASFRHSWAITMMVSLPHA